MSERKVPFKTLVNGESGTGKTYSIATLLACGQKVRFLAAENNALSGIYAGVAAYKGTRSESDLAIMVPKRQKSSIADLAKLADKSLTIPVSTQLTQVDPNRKNYDRYLNVLKGLAEFQGEDGKSYGSIDSWGLDTTLVVDGLTIICEAIQQAMIGSKLGTTQPEFYAMQNTLQTFLRTLTEDLECNLVLIAHPDKDIDAVSGKQTIYPANIGKALNNKVPSMFTDVVWAFRKGKDFLWSTDHPQAVTRASNLPIAAEMKQDFALFFK